MTFDGLLDSAQALLDLDAKNALVPHGIGGHARSIIEGCIENIRHLCADNARLENEVRLHQERDAPTLERGARALTDHAYVQKGLVKCSDAEWATMRDGCCEGFRAALSALVEGDGNG